MQKQLLLTRSLNEMVRLGVKLGGQKETYSGLSGFGDLVATCSGEWSRNRTFGQRIGEGETPTAIVESQNSVVEGYLATKCLQQICAEIKSGRADTWHHLCHTLQWSRSLGCDAAINDPRLESRIGIP